MLWVRQMGPLVDERGRNPEAVPKRLSRSSEASDEVRLLTGAVRIYSVIASERCYEVVEYVGHLALTAVGLLSENHPVCGPKTLS